MQKLFLCFVLVLMLSACKSGSVDPGAVQTAIAQTAAVNPTSTPSPKPSATSSPTATTTPTETFTPTSTETVTPTATPTDTPSPTPDLRVIDVDPHEFLLKASDLPENAKYYLPDSSWISPHRNYEVVSGWGVDKGRDYLEKTGRVDGWWVYYLRGTRTVIAPEEIGDNPVLFSTTAGAQLLITQFGNCAKPDTEFLPLQTDLMIGDMTNVCFRREMQSSGENRYLLLIEFSYRNVTHKLSAWGWEKEVRLEYLQDIALNLLAKLEAAPLSDKVTWQP